MEEPISRERLHYEINCTFIPVQKTCLQINSILWKDLKCVVVVVIVVVIIVVKRPQEEIQLINVL